MKILLIEDDLDLQHTISEFLIHEQMLVEVASTCTQAIDKLISFPYDCVILDMMLPDGSGMDVLKEIKYLNIDTAVVILSAKNSVEDKVEGLMVGAVLFNCDKGYIEDCTFENNFGRCGGAIYGGFIYNSIFINNGASTGIQ